jgi:hypothetical protein
MTKAGIRTPFSALTKRGAPKPKPERGLDSKAEASVKAFFARMGPAEIAEGLTRSPKFNWEWSCSIGSGVASDAAASNICAMPYHRFKVGQTIVAPSDGPHALISRGPHVIVRLLPVVDGVPQYRIRSTADGNDRVVPEGQITPIQEWPVA